MYFVQSMCEPTFGHRLDEMPPRSCETSPERTYKATERRDPFDASDASRDQSVLCIAPIIEIAQSLAIDLVPSTMTTV